MWEPIEEEAKGDPYSAAIASRNAWKKADPVELQILADELEESSLANDAKFVRWVYLVEYGDKESRAKAALDTPEGPFLFAFATCEQIRSLPDREMIHDEAGSRWVLKCP